MERIAVFCIVDFILFCIFCLTQVGSQSVCPMGNAFEGLDKKALRNQIRACIANCLSLASPTNYSLNSKSCKYSQKTANPVDEPCPAKLLPSRKDKIIMCHYTSSGGRISFSKNPSFKSCDFIVFDTFKYNVSSGTFVPRPNMHLPPILAQMAEARQLGLKNVFSLGTWDEEILAPETFAAIADDPKWRVKFAEVFLAILKKYPYDGVFVQWFWPGCPKGVCIKTKEKDSVIAFMKFVIGPMRDELGLKIFFYVHLSFPMGPMTFLMDYYSSISPFVDYFVVDSNDKSGPSTADFHNSLAKTTNFLTPLIKMVADKTFADKLMIEISPVARAYEIQGTGKPKIGAPSDKNSKVSSTLSLRDYCHLGRNKSVTVVSNATTMTYLYTGNYMLIYEDLISLRGKADFLLERGAGFYLLAIHEDDQEGKCGCGTTLPFLQMAAESLKGRECALKPCY